MQQNGTLIESFLWLVLDNDLLVCVCGGGVGSQRLCLEPASQEEVLGIGRTEVEDFVCSL